MSNYENKTYVVLRQHEMYRVAEERRLAASLVRSRRKPFLAPLFVYAGVLVQPIGKNTSGSLQPSTGCVASQQT